VLLCFCSVFVNVQFLYFMLVLQLAIPLLSEHINRNYCYYCYCYYCYCYYCYCYYCANKFLRYKKYVQNVYLKAS